MRPQLFLALILLGLGSSARAEDPFQSGLQAEARGDSEAALVYFQAADRARPDDPKIAQRLARQYSDLCDFQGSPATQKAYAMRALEYSQLADRLEPNNAEHVLSIAISYGKLGRLGDCGTRAKIDYSRLVKKEAERAAALDPNYAWAHYLIGRWNYEVSQLAHGTRLLVGVFYGGLGDASNAVAIRELKRATELQSGEPAMWVDLGFAYQAAGQSEEARRAWKKALELPGAARYQTAAKERAKLAFASR